MEPHRMSMTIATDLKGICSELEYKNAADHDDDAFLWDNLVNDYLVCICGLNFFQFRKYFELIRLRNSQCQQ